MSIPSAKPTFASRSFTSRSGATLTFTELGFGTAPIGNLYQAVDEASAQLAMQAAWTAGCRYFDTAPLYGLGLAETRLNFFLKEQPRDNYVLSTKVGRLLKPCKPDERTGIGKFFNTPSRKDVFDYSYDGVMRSLEASLERLGLDSVDVLFAHNLDIATHGSQEACDQRIKELMQSGYSAMAKLRDEGVVKAIGVGANEWQACETLAKAGDFDLFLLAGRYTLLEQEALTSFLPLCEQKSIGIIVGSPFNSGILATGPRPEAFYNYQPAPAAILDRVALIERICSTHKVKLAEASLRFPLGHRQVMSVIPGSQLDREVLRNAEMMATRIPKGLWDDLKSEGLMHPDAPVPK